ncbi:EF-hand domain-containing protein [Pirellulaceae bacterium SH449]
MKLWVSVVRNAAACLLCTFIASSGMTRGDGQHDMLLLLPDGPIHFRLFVTDGDHPLRAKREQYVDRLIKTLDTDQDGQLSRQETAKHPLFVMGRRFDDNPFLQSLRTRKPYTRHEIDLAVERSAGQLMSYRQENVVADQDLSVFRVLDQDESGLIDAAEMRLAASRIAALDFDMDQCITFDEFLPNQTATPSLVVVTSLDQEAPKSILSELLRDAREPTMPARLVRMYDKDRDAHLTAQELGWPQDRFSILDADHDGKLNMQELSQIANAHPDAVFSVNLGEATEKIPAGMQTLHANLDSDSKQDSQSADGYFTMSRSHINLSVGYRHRDPLREARENAITVFNTIDVDANGYLDMDEIAEHQRFARYLFEAMDRDNDGRVFAEEMLDYVREYTEPATTTCQVTLIDSGNGFFQLLDQNNDGRISIRELRTLEQRLRELANNEGVINPSRMRQSFRIEIQRGGISLFGKVSRTSATEVTTASLRPPTGPMWFQRMDRNGDGDITWDEFLGPRHVFHEIDTDQDGLIDADEATRYDKKLKDAR